MLFPDSEVEQTALVFLLQPRLTAGPGLLWEGMWVISAAYNLYSPHSVAPESSVGSRLGRVLNANSKLVLNLPLKALCSGTDTHQKQMGGSFS